MRILIFLIIFILLCSHLEWKEHFGLNYQPGYHLPMYYPATFWLPQRRRNSSRDLRGDIPIPVSITSPWYQPSVGPMYNRRMILI